MMQVTDRDIVATIIAELGASLPELAPRTTGVHFNSLQGFQHLPFETALAKATALTGIPYYCSEAQFRDCYQQNRINDHDVSIALKEHYSSTLETPLLNLPGRIINAAEIYRLALLYEFDPILPNQLAWQIEEIYALERFQSDVPMSVRQSMLSNKTLEQALIGELWQTLLAKLDLEQACLHPENMLDLSLDQAESLLAQHKASIKKISLKKSSMHEQMRDTIQLVIAQDLQRVGVDLSFRSLLMALCGIDILDFVRPQIIRICSSALDEGVAAWTLPRRGELGLYASWRNLAGYDIDPFLQELPDWQAILLECPHDPLEAIMVQLKHLEIPETRWQGYLERTLLEIPGWSSLFHWRERHPDYTIVNDPKPTLADYLAIRLTLDRLWLNQVCRDTWQIEAKLSSLKAYFHKNASEYMVRSHLFRGDLPEYLIEQAEAMTTNVGSERYNRSDWQQLADMIWTWQSSLMTNCRPSHSVATPGIISPTQALKTSVYGSGWRLFRLCQHLGLSAQDVEQISKNELEQLLALLDSFTALQRSQVWQEAYENHYRDQLLANLRQNAPEKQSYPLLAHVVFCMDTREETLRRVLEQVCSEIETFGHSGFHLTSKHTQRDLNPPRLSEKCSHLGNNLLFAPFSMALVAPLVLMDVLTQVISPNSQPNWLRKLQKSWFPQLLSEYSFDSATTGAHSTAFDCFDSIGSLEASVDLLSAKLIQIGLATTTSPFIIWVGQTARYHHNQNTDPGLCESTRDITRNFDLRRFVRLANQPEFREKLSQTGVTIPNDTWFIYVEPHLASATLIWSDLEDLPEKHQVEFNRLKACFEEALTISIQDNTIALLTGLTESNTGTLARSMPKRTAESHYAMHAAVLIGRRSMSRGLNLGQRVFLVSYDPTIDPDGSILEDILLQNLPTLLTINLDYFFSRANPKDLGSGSKILHNNIGSIGVMEGCSSDLKFGLAQQIIERHESMRLQFVIETSTDILEQILTRQPHLKALIDHRWLHISVNDPQTHEFIFYSPRQNFAIESYDARSVSHSRFTRG